MSFSLNYDDIVSKFDELIKQQIVHFTETKPIHLVDQEFNFEYRISQSLIGKPQAEGAIQLADHNPENGVHVRPKCFGPGSDIANEHPDLLVQVLHGTHLLVISKFPMFRSHLLLLTVDSYRRQDETLNIDDFRAAWAVVEGAGIEFYALFNCTPTAGASLWHKHMQIIPKPFITDDAGNRFRFFPDRNPPPPSATIPYVHFLQHIKDLPEDVNAASEQLYKLYLQLLSLTKVSLNISSNEPVCPHNVILTRNWIMSIPRRSSNYHGVTANGAGMMGSVWLQKDSQLDDWKIHGPAKVLSELGVPTDKSVQG